MTERIYGRVEQFDDRSRFYGISHALAAPQLQEPVTKMWDVPPPAPLDQGQTSKCVGYSWTHRLISDQVRNMGSAEAGYIYKTARTIDGLPDRQPGTSVLAGAKVVQRQGFITGYRWAFSEPELAAAIAFQGAAILGVQWTADMETPDAGDFITPTGPVVGGHAILCVGIDVEHGFYTLVNSWGPRWGYTGRVRIRRTDMATLLGNRGEACIPTRSGKR
jgi:hypothetical protein